MTNYEIMKTIFRFQLITLISFVFLLASCNDDDPAGPSSGGRVVAIENQKEKQQMSNRDFVIFDYITYIDGVKDQDLSSLDSCSLDDIFRFNSNGTLLINEGPNRCYFSPLLDTTNWDLSPSGDSLFIGDDLTDGVGLEILINNGFILQIGETQIFDNDNDGIDETFLQVITFERN